MYERVSFRSDLVVLYKSFVCAGRLSLRWISRADRRSICPSQGQLGGRRCHRGSRHFPLRRCRRLRPRVGGCVRAPSWQSVAEFLGPRSDLQWGRDGASNPWRRRIISRRLAHRNANRPRSLSRTDCSRHSDPHRGPSRRFAFPQRIRLLPLGVCSYSLRCNEQLLQTAPRRVWLSAWQVHRILKITALGDSAPLQNCGRYVAHSHAADS